jgi:hypothetical protein
MAWLRPADGWQLHPWSEWSLRREGVIPNID